VNQGKRRFRDASPWPFWTQRLPNTLREDQGSTESRPTGLGLQLRRAELQYVQVAHFREDIACRKSKRPQRILRLLAFFAANPLLVAASPRCGHRALPFFRDNLAAGLSPQPEEAAGGRQFDDHPLLSIGADTLQYRDIREGPVRTRQILRRLQIKARGIISILSPVMPR
jgi:hypothetical protein